MVDIAGDKSTTSVIAVGSTTNGSVEVGGDHDWFQISLTVGQNIQVTMNGLGLSALEDPFLRIRDSAGNILFENDDGGAGRNAFIAFQASYTGVYYFDVAAWDEVPAQYNYVGDYELKVENFQQPVGTIADFVDQLVNGYWDGDSHHFAVSEGGSITVNLTALAAGGQSLARSALGAWTDIIGVRFTEVGTGGQIIFDDDEPGAFASAVYSNGITTSARVNVSTLWHRDYGSALNTYTYQAYIHEIGHALGLGHAGNYNETAGFPFDARFQNDSWPMTVMSYFDQRENSYFANQGFTQNFANTPMLADIQAMASLYGLSSTTRLGDTTYTFGGAGSGVQSIYDSGGNDWIYGSGYSGSQRIDLNPGTFSNIHGDVGNVSIALGVVIENALGGTGDDTLVGNSANNSLEGGDGNDTVSYESASAGVTVNLGLAGPQDTIGAGTDTLVSFENLVGSNFADRLTAGAGFTIIRGGGGNDTLGSTGDGDRLYGEAGDDTFSSGVGNDLFDGGEGFDTVDYSSASGAVRAGGGSSGGVNGLDSFASIERIIGSKFDDQLSGAAVIIGGAGDDIIGQFAVSGTGGTGNDIYNGVGVGALVVEAAGEGIDLVRSFIDYTLPENVENLTLLELFDPDPYAGAAVPTGPPPPNPVNGTGNALNNVITGNKYANQLSGLMGADTLTGGAGSDTFRDSAAGLNGDTIADFTADDRLIITDANPETFRFSLSGTTLTYSGGSLTFGSTIAAGLTARAAAGGGVELAITGPLFGSPSMLANFGAAPGSGSWSSDDRQPRLLADVNGDARTDIVGFGENGVYVSLGTSAGSFAAPFLATTAFAGAIGWSSNDRYVRLLADVNADGRADIIGFGNEGVYVALSTPDGSFAAAGLVLTGFSAGGGWSSNDLYMRQLGDVNGDGKVDIVGFGNEGVYVALGTGNGSFTAPTLAITAFGAAASAGGWSSNDHYLRQLADVNGDGKSDIVGFGNDGVYVALGTASGSFAAPTLALTAFGAGANGGGWSSNNLYLRQLVDVNGDGRADIVGFGNDGVFVALAAANGSFASPTLGLRAFGAAPGAGGWSSDALFPRELADVNGDGKLDVVGFGSNGVHIAFGNGDGTFEASKPDVTFFGSQPGAGNWTGDDAFPRHLADVNNDGAADIVGFSSGGVYVSVANGDLFI